MKNISESYAMGLQSAARELGCESEVADELKDVALLYGLCGAYFADKTRTEMEKARVLQEALVGRVHPLTLEFAILMLTRRQFKYFPETAERYLNLCGASDAPVQLRVPFELDAALLERLKTRLIQEGLIPAQHADSARFEVIAEPELLGGFIAAYGGYQLDASLKTTLNKIALS